MRSVHKLGQLTAGQVLAADGLISLEQLQELVMEQQQSGERITDIAIERSLVTEFDIAKAMVRHLQLPFVEPVAYDTPEEVKEVLSPELLRQVRVVPLDKFATTVSVATCGDISARAIQEIESQASCKVGLFIALRSSIERALEDRHPAPTLEDGMGEEVASRLDQIFGS